MPALKLLIILLFSLVSILAHAGTAIIEQERTHLNLTPLLSHYEDTHSALSLKEVIELEFEGNFEELQNPVENFGLTRSTHWFHTTLTTTNPKTKNFQYLISLTTPYLDSVTFYLLRNGKVETIQMGDQQPFNTRPIPDPNFLLPLNISPDVDIELFIKIKTDGAILIPLELWEATVYSSKKIEYYVFYGIYYGIMLAMLLYNLIIFTYVRARSYIYYALFVTSSIIYQASFAGHAFMYLWPNSGWLANHIFGLAPTACLIFGGLFTQRLLKTKQNLSIFHSILNVFIAIGFILMITSLFIDNHSASRLISLYTLTSCGLALVLGSVATLRRIELARFYLLAWSILVICAIWHALVVINVVTLSTVSIHPLMVGTALEAFLLSAALARRTALAQERARTTLHIANKELQMSNRIKDDFFATISHELRTPINGIKGALYLLGQIKLPNESKSFLNAAKQSSDDILNLANDLSSYAESNAAKIDSQQQVFALTELKESLEKEFKTPAQTKGLKFEVTLPESTYLIGDRINLQTILNKLVDNAIKFTQLGKVMVEFNYEAVTEPGNEVNLFITITDTGIGIPESFQTKIYTPFQQTNQSTARGYKGLGIGLSICYNLVQRLKGHIEISSHIGRGSKFKVSIPFQQANAEFIEEMKKKQQQKQGLQSEHLPLGIEVLLVEDNITNQMLLGSILTKQGCQVNFASNGREAINHLSTQTPDIIFMDCRMPVMDLFIIK